jgi:hypothetical protein
MIQNTIILMLRQGRVYHKKLDIEIPTPGSDVGTVMTRAVTHGYWIFHTSVKKS